MTPKIYFSIVSFILLNVALFTSGTDYQDQCVNDGDVICINCQTVGACHQNEDMSFRVDFQFTCISGEVCYSSAGDNADCYRLSSTVTPECMCDAPQECSVDPYDDSSYVTCGDDASRSYGVCLEGKIYNSDSCECEIECPVCGYYSANDGTCENYFSCETGTTLPGRCPDTYCFDEDTCQCLAPGGECPECGYRADPSDPEGFFYCENNPESPGKCPNGYHFDADLCSCTDTVVTASTPGPTTTAFGGIQCGECGYAPYPNDICEKYYHCNSDGTVSIENCPPGLCYNAETCACDVV